MLRSPLQHLPRQGRTKARGDVVSLMMLQGVVRETNRNLPHDDKVGKSNGKFTNCGAKGHSTTDCHRPGGEGKGEEPSQSPWGESGKAKGEKGAIGKNKGQKSSQETGKRSSGFKPE